MTAGQGRDGAKRGDRRRHWDSVGLVLTAALLSFTGLTVMMQMYTVIAIAPEIAADLGASSDQILLGVTSFALPTAFGFLAFGPLSDAVGRRSVIGIGLLAIAGSMVGTGQSDSVTEFHLWRALHGFASGTFSPPAIAYINRVMPVGVRASATAGITTGFLTATVIGQAYAQVTVGSVGWRGVWFVTAPVFIVLALLVALLPAEKDFERRVAPWRAYPTMLRLWRRPDLRVCFIAAIPLLLIIVAVYAGLTARAEPVDGLLGVRLAAAPAMLLALLASKAVNRFGAVDVFRACALLGALALFALGIADGRVLLTVTSVVAVAAITFAVPTLLSLIGGRAGPLAGSALAITTFLLVSGASLSPPIALAVVEHFGFAVLCLLLAASLICSGALLGFARPVDEGV